MDLVHVRYDDKNWSRFVFIVNPIFAHEVKSRTSEFKYLKIVIFYRTASWMDV